MGKQKFRLKVLSEREYIIEIDAQDEYEAIYIIEEGNFNKEDIKHINIKDYQVLEVLQPKDTK